jgi:hypothetical protein
MIGISAMAHLISKTLLALSLSITATALVAAPAAAPAETKKPAKAKPKASKAKEPVSPLIAHEDEPDISDTITVNYNCELGNKITIHQNESKPETIALRWKQRLHRLSRVGTTTGALRFENKNTGLIWIGIPSKGMLLDSRQNRQLANECKNPDQEKIAAKSTNVESTKMKL